MIRIGMIGADSTHTEAYASLMNLPDAPLGSQARVVKLWGEDPNEARQKAVQCRIPEVVGTPAEVLTDVDAVMICNRYGDDHPPHARLALRAGLPTFVDKPFTNDLAEAREIVGLAGSGTCP